MEEKTNKNENNLSLTQLNNIIEVVKIINDMIYHTIYNYIGKEYGIYNKDIVKIIDCLGEDKQNKFAIKVKIEKNNGDKGINIYYNLQSPDNLNILSIAYMDLKLTEELNNSFTDIIEKIKEKFK